MGWKSTADISREHAIQLATKELAKKIGEIHAMSDTELERTETDFCTRI